MRREMKMKNYMRSLVILAALLFGAVNEVWGQSVEIANTSDTQSPYTIKDGGTTTGTINAVSVSDRTVTLTVTPASGYYITADDIKVEPLVDPSHANVPNRRVPDLANQIVGKMYNDETARAAANIINSISGQNNAYYVFEVPAQYDGVYVTATFTSLTSEETIITGSTTSVTYSATSKYVLTDDVEASVLANLYTGSQTTAFSGTLEGVAKADGTFPVITWPASGFSHALFDKINGGTVKNIMLKDVKVSEETNAGAIANEANGATRIYNCGIFGTVTITKDETTGVTTRNNTSTISGTGKVGGLVGLLDGTARVINCFSYADVSGGNNSDVGGIVGYNSFASTAGNIRTMVMNCMFYGDITGGTNKSPVYGGNNINNLNNGKTDGSSGLNTFNYYAYEQLPTSHISSGKYNCALAVEEKYLNRFEFYRLLLNSNKKLAAFYATGSTENANEKMAKWVLETADRSISGRAPYPYPILKAQGYYPSIINPDFENAPDSATFGRNHGGKLPSPRRTLSVTIKTTKSDGGQTWPEGVSFKRTYLELVRTDKDFDRFNFNYDKVQLPYYNDVGTKNYTGNRVVTGWKITAITGGTAGTYTASDNWGGYNFADRNCTQKDLYSVSERVFSQGAYFDVPYGVTAITIEPYWGKAAYISDPKYDVVYKADYSGKQEVNNTGTQVTVGTTFFDGEKFGTSDQLETAAQRIENKVSDALSFINKAANQGGLGGYGPTVYDNAIVLVGNLHQDAIPSNSTNPFTLMSVDLDNDHEPDYSMIYHHKGKLRVCPIRFDFLNIPGTAQAQKPNGANDIFNMAIIHPSAWFEITNTSSIYFSQLEYEDLVDNASRTDGPLILQGGVLDQFVSTNNTAVNGKTTYMHLGGNVWFKEFNMGTHGDGSQSTPHPPVSVTGGEYEGFYLTGIFNQDAAVRTDDAECYISGGHFEEAAGTGQEAINGNVRWQIYNADIDNFFGGGTNGATGKNIKGDVTVDIFNSHVTTFCGGPKFGNMESGKKVTTNAEGCTFGTYYGAGYGGLSYSRKKYFDATSYNFTNLQKYYYNPGSNTTHENERGKYYDGTSTNAVNAKYGKKGPGVATDFDYEFFVWSSGKTGARFYVKFATFSLAQCNDVESKLKNCTIENNFYGGGSLGKVVGTVNSELDGCTVKGNVYGAGFSASLPTLEVRDEGFTTNPNYNSASGMFEPGTKSGTTTFTWRNISDAQEDGTTLTLVNDKIKNGTSGSNLNKHYIYTDIDLSSSNLGSVAGNVNLTIKGDSKIGTDGINDKDHGNVFGGGAQSYVTKGTTGTGNVTVKLQGNTEVLGNVFGGGDQGVVEGSTEVIIEN